MTETPIPTDFSGLADPDAPVETYSGVTDVIKAKREGDYEENRQGLRKPWTLPLYRPPEIRSIL
jgi:hypothetical protein